MAGLDGSVAGAGVPPDGMASAAVAGAALAALWNLTALLAVNALAVRCGWWSFGSPADPVVGAQASALHRDALAMLDRIVAERWLTAKAVFGLWQAQRIGDDVRVEAAGESTLLHFLRQQVDKPVERPDVCLADFIAPEGRGIQDWIGAFAVTAGLGIERRKLADERARLAGEDPAPRKPEPPQAEQKRPRGHKH